MLLYVHPRTPDNGGRDTKLHRQGSDSGNGRGGQPWSFSSMIFVYIKTTEKEYHMENVMKVLNILLVVNACIVLPFGRSV